MNRLNGPEVVARTRRHVVAEFFRVDWPAANLGVPVLHLSEQNQNTPRNRSTDTV